MDVQVLTRITHISWGKMEVDVKGEVLKFKDCKVWYEGAKEWDWGLTGTRHEPGIQPADIAELLDHGVEVIILSRGMELKLHAAPETEQFLRERNIPYHIEETTRAVELFNELSAQGKRVGGVFHSTC